LGTLYYYGDDVNLSKYKRNVEFNFALGKLKELKQIGLDVETNLATYEQGFKLTTVQISNIKGDEVYVFQMSFLDAEEKHKLLSYLASPEVVKICQNVPFEYNRLQQEGYIAENFWDTMIAEKVIKSGEAEVKGSYSLETVIYERFGVLLNKDMQKQFGDNIITDEKLEYAAMDVVYLGRLARIQYLLLKADDQLEVMKLENENILALADMSYEGFTLDVPKWLDNIEKAQPLLDASIEELNTILKEDFREQAIKDKFLFVESQIRFNKRSSTDKLKLLSLVFDDIEGTSEVYLKSYLKEKDSNFPNVDGMTARQANPIIKEYLSVYENNNFTLIKLLLNKDYLTFFNAFLTNFRETVIKEGLYLPENSVDINWGSTSKVLKVFQYVDPRITSTAAEVVADNLHKHRIFKSYQRRQFSNSLLTKFGYGFLDKVDPDGRIRSRYDPIKTTGRIGSSSPKICWAA